MLQRVIDEVKPEVLTIKSGTKMADPWLYFYEEFLSEYDPDLRRDMGVYYTPVPIVRAQVHLVDEILTKRMGKRFGFADEGVTTLDPAVGTGTYLLGIIEHALGRVGSGAGKGGLGKGAVPAKASELAECLYGFEIMAGPYAVAELRVAQQLEAFGATLPKDTPHIYLTNTLESPHTVPPAPPLFYDDIAREHERALKVKEEVPVLVCIGNPPYDRHAATGDRFWTGGWVRHGDEGDPNSIPILEDFLKPVRDAGKGSRLGNLYNLYVYFWRWALWKVFEHDNQGGPGIVTFISASSYMDGDAFAGMREKIRRLCDEVWVIDLGGEGRGPRQSENVFNIQTPVAIAIAIRIGVVNQNVPAKVSYARIEGTRQEKYEKLNSISSLSDLPWTVCPDGWSDRFRPSGSGDFFDLPELIDLFPWQHTGITVNRTWPIAPEDGILVNRWRALLSLNNRSKAFHEAQNRYISRPYPSLDGSKELPAIASLPEGTHAEATVPYAFRTLDRQRIIADNRLMSRPRPPLWLVQSDNQIYITSLFTSALGSGPGITVCSNIPDRHHFRGSFGGKDIIPLWRDPKAIYPNPALII
jgi:predicted helicase